MASFIVRDSDLTSPAQAAPFMPLPQQILLVRPTYFSLNTPINPHMTQRDGSLHSLDWNRAARQWKSLKEAYEKLGFYVHVVEGEKELPDMVFAANQTLPYVDVLGNKKAILSNMRNETRHREVAYLQDFLIRQGYQCHTLGNRAPDNTFEGMGDALWLPGHRFLLAGYGPRTEKKTYDAILPQVDSRVALFELAHPRFYHLDTCLCVLSAGAALACSAGFTESGWALLKKIFPVLIEVSLQEADSPGFACNAHCPDGKHVLIQKGNKETESQLMQKGFKVVSLDTDEYIKSGGSVFCMKLMFY